MSDHGRHPFRFVEARRPGPNAAYGGGSVVTYKVLDAQGELMATLHSRFEARADAIRIVEALNAYWHTERPPAAPQGGSGK